MKPRITAYATGLMLAVGGSPADAQCTESESVELVSSDLSGSDNFGVALALDGNTLLVGANGDDDNGSSSGSAYVFERSGSSWTETHKLTASDGALSDFFGWSVALQGDVAVIGARGKQSDRGAVYVFRELFGSWVEEQKLVASNGVVADEFGWDVALDDDVIVVGARRSGASLSAGSVYVFEHDGAQWVEVQELQANDGFGGDEFGFSLALHDQTLLVGARGEFLADPGAAFVFEHDGAAWQQTQKLDSTGIVGNANFGYAVALRGDLAAVGAREDDAAANRAGSVFVYRRSAGIWSQEVQLLPDAVAGLGLGSSVSVGNDAVAAGFNHGVSLFRHQGIPLVPWAQQLEWTPADAPPPAALGQNALVLDGDLLLAGARNDSPPPQAGSVHILDVPGISLDIDPDLLVGPGTVSFVTCGGGPGNPVGLFIVDVSGVPVFVDLIIASFDAFGTWSLDIPVPAGLAGIAITFQSYGFPPVGGLAGSNLETLELQ